MRRFPTLVALAVAVIAAAGLAGCEPPPPRAQFAVTTTAAGADDDKGDGACHSTAGGGCTLQAAIQEGNTAANGADITLPPGDYAAFSAGITGDVRITAVTPASTRLGASPGVFLTVLRNGRLQIADLNTGGDDLPGPFHVAVDGGVFLAHRSALAGEYGVAPWVPLRIVSTGVALLIDSMVHAPESTIVVNEGTLVAVNSSLLNSYAPNGLVTQGFEWSSSVLRGSAIARFNTYEGTGSGCDGVPPISHGYVHIEEPCGSVPNPTDGEGNAQYQRSDTARPYLEAPSPLIDAIPVTDPACDVTSLDVYGNPRGVDGNGDGIPGCDIGAIERQPSSAT